MISVWTNTEELKVLESCDHPLKACAYIAKWDTRERIGCARTANVRDGEPKRVYYSIRLEIEAGGHIIRSYGEGVDREQSYYANRKNAIGALKTIFQDMGIPFKVLKDGKKVGVSRIKALLKSPFEKMT